jgi:hypothetical protein
VSLRGSRHHHSGRAGLVAVAEADHDLLAPVLPDCLGGVAERSRSAASSLPVRDRGQRRRCATTLTSADSSSRCEPSQRPRRQQAQGGKEDPPDSGRAQPRFAPICCATGPARPSRARAARAGARPRSRRTRGPARGRRPAPRRARPPARARSRSAVRSHRRAAGARRRRCQLSNAASTDLDTPVSSRGSARHAPGSARAPPHVQAAEPCRARRRAPRCRP